MQPNKKTAPARAALNSKLAYDNSLIWAKQGKPVFSCNYLKRPTTKNGFKDATTDHIVLKEQFQNPASVYIGMPTGYISEISVLDIDPVNDGTEWLDQNFTRLPLTRLYQTRSGGWHFWFRHRKGLRISAGKIARGVDIRAEGGYVILWVAAGYPTLNTADPAPFPDWLFEKAQNDILRQGSIKSGSLKNFSPTPNYPYNQNPKFALRRASARISQADEGTRNNCLYREALSILRIVKLRYLKLEFALNSLALAAQSVGLSEKEINSTLASAVKLVGAV